MRARAGAFAVLALALGVITAPPAAAADAAPGRPIQVIPFAEDYPAYGVAVGGPGAAAANAAVADVCHDGAPLGQPQWFTLPYDDTGQLLLQARAIDTGRGATAEPAGVAVVRTATGEVLRCDAGVLEPSLAGGQLSIVVWFLDEAGCSPAEPSCENRRLQLSIDPTSGVAPDNDAFANARPVTSVPFRDTVDTTLATADGPELIDYVHCAASTVIPDEQRTVWWRYTPTTSQDFPSWATSTGSDVFVGIAVMTPSGPVRAPRWNEQNDPWNCTNSVWLEAGRTYYFGVAVADDAYESYQLRSGGTVELRLGNVPTPSLTVVSTTVDSGARTVQLAWYGGGVPVTGWRVSRDGVDSNGTAAWSTTLPASVTTATISSLTPWDSYRVSVQAISAAGAGPAVTRIVSLQGPAPSEPTAVGATRGPGEATVRWSPPVREGGSAISGYRVRRFAGTSWTPVASTTLPATARSFTATGLTGGPWSFEVVAINSAGAGRWARTPLVVPSAGAPGVPGSVAATVDESARSATLSWQPPAGDVTGYRVARDGIDANGAGPWSTTLPATARSQTFTSLTSAAPYTLTVQAITAAGTGPAAPVTVRLQTPERPRDVAVTRGNGQATVAWTAPAVTGISAVTGYRVRRYAGTSATVLATSTVAASARSFTATGLANGTAYTFDVTATNAAGPGAASARSVTVTPATVPGYPGIQAAAPGTAGGAVTATATWTGPTSNGGSAITGWRVTALRMSATDTVLGSTVSPLVAAAARSYEMTLPQAGNYRFTVQAVNDVGTGAASARSNLVAGR